MTGNEFDDEPLYEPLDTIRLLRLPWGKDPSQFDGYLCSFALNSASCPDFVALSYTWGHSIHPKPINLNGHPFDVLATLYPFLKLAPNLPEFSAETWWWIDSICINQKDNKEKSAQMQIMGKIYERAFKTVVWLGEEVDANFGEDSKDCTHAISSLYRLCTEMDKVPRGDITLLKSELRKLTGSRGGVDWQAIKRLFLRPWWRRVWTLQEFLISNQLRFYCGKDKISRQGLQDAVYAAWICKAWHDDLLGRGAFHAGWNRRRMNQWYEKRKHEMGLIAMMAYVGDSGATDERDRVYSLLGVVRDSDLVRPLDPNSSVEDVYAELVKSFIAKYRSLDIICYCHLFNQSDRDSDSKRTLPSWIPDWRSTVVDKVIPVMASQGSSAGAGNFRPAWVEKSDVVYNASHGRHPVAHISKDFKILTCTGLVLDRIDGLGGSKDGDSGEIVDSKDELSLEQSTSEHNIHENAQRNSTALLMETISRCLVLDRADRYLTETMAPGLFREDFKTYCKAYFQDPDEKNIPTLFHEWFTRNKSLRIHGRTLEDHSREWSLHAHLPPWKDFEGGRLKRFYGRLDDTVVGMARRLTVTEKGYLGMAASRAGKGDLICVLLGCSVPVLLRERDGGAFEFIGECYVQGFMNGEALDKEIGLNERQFRIL